MKLFLMRGVGPQPQFTGKNERKRQLLDTRLADLRVLSLKWFQRSSVDLMDSLLPKKGK
jgi:hypothetical protein